ncbi:MAG TPA: nicotinate-nucleotide adenylyltransferase [Allosphingosinicella sp.]|jgi:nicotinate-nucleotide adenylyltransferase|uniref:nicotinate-nucleotide adenylyltransferase n=1 Tax=Allosphingosinicella sp. TaxID=2823234 RepID=UPI002F288831
MIRTGLLGGSFNPAHRGHRRLSRHALGVLGLDELWWLVSPGNPLKEVRGMAPLPVRYRSAQRAARGLPIRVTAIECQLGTAYTAETLRLLRRRFPERQFVWLMGADNLSQFHLWRDWRGIAHSVPIAVVGRPGYDGAARAARAMGWLRRFVRPAGQASRWTEWRLPALVLLHMPPDPTSATLLRAAEPDWHLHLSRSLNPSALRDGVTRRPLTARRHIASTRTGPA